MKTKFEIHRHPTSHSVSKKFGLKRSNCQIIRLWFNYLMTHFWNWLKTLRMLRAWWPCGPFGPWRIRTAFAHWPTRRRVTRSDRRSTEDGTAPSTGWARRPGRRSGDIIGLRSPFVTKNTKNWNKKIRIHRLSLRVAILHDFIVSNVIMKIWKILRYYPRRQLDDYYLRP